MTRRAALGLSDALWTGAWIGALVAIAATLPAAILYFARWRLEVDAPWLQLGEEGLSFLVVTGALYGASMTAAMSRIAPGHRARTVLASALGGALGGVLPGAYGALRFGALPFPWFGTAQIMSAVVLAVLLFGLTLVRALVPGVQARRALLGAIVPAPFVALVIGPLAALTFLADADLDAIRAISVSVGLAGAGSIVGVIVGLVLGGWLGASVVFARAVASRSADAPRVRVDRATAGARRQS